ncbi:right-handed parallel beta-helix repeat-containing protein [Rubripirellula reticaptiva]|nr:right-handed parallel beta-helix repeat-containing protein [Rubripirellula reticaptiva]
MASAFVFAAVHAESNSVIADTVLPSSPDDQAGDQTGDQTGDQAGQVPDGPFVPRPFWRKKGDSPTFAPDWYANRGEATVEVHFDSSKTAAQNGELLKRTLSNLSAGDHVRIHAGTYVVDSLLVIQAQGTRSFPVTIEGAPGEEVIVTRSDARQNALNVDRSEYLIVERLTLRGGSTGLKLQSANHFMLHDVEIVGTANNAIAANSASTSYLYFIDNEIHDTASHGEGFYLGSHDGQFVTHHTFVIGNYIHDLNHSDVDQGDGVEIKDGSYAVIIKQNFIRGTKYPGIIVYRTGREPADRNVIEENVILDSGDNAIQATADAIIRNNLIITGVIGIMSKPSGTAPRDLTIVNNTIIAKGDAIKTIDWDTPESTGIRVANNAIFTQSGRAVANGFGNARSTANVVVSELSKTFKNVQLDGSGLDANPLETSNLVGVANAADLPGHDLSGRVRTGSSDVGALGIR